MKHFNMRRKRIFIKYIWPFSGRKYPYFTHITFISRLASSLKMASWWKHTYVLKRFLFLYTHTIKRNIHLHIQKGEKINKYFSVDLASSILVWISAGSRLTLITVCGRCLLRLRCLFNILRTYLMHNCYSRERFTRVARLLGDDNDG